MNRLQQMGILVCLTALAWQDARDGEVDGRWMAAMAGWGFLPKILPGLFSAAGAVMRTQTDTIDGRALLYGLIPGMILWVVSVLSDEAVGAGDALSLWALGFSLDGFLCVDILTDSLWMTACCALWSRRWNLRNRVPWIPFLWLAFLTHLAIA